MSFKFKTLAIIGAFVGALALIGCGEDKPQSTAQTQTTPNRIKVGVITGSELEVAELAKKIAKDRYNLDVELVIFNDYVMPNEALNNGDIDINAFQHKPYLDQQIKDRGYKLAIVGNTFVYPIAGYSKKIKSVDEITEGSVIAIPNDPTNLGRSLLLLQQIGLIKLNDNVGLLPTVLDITENPRNIKIIELEAPQLPHSLDDPQVTAAIINTAYSSQIDLTPSKDGIFVEDKESPYVNIIVSREDNKNDVKVKEYIKAYQSDEVEAKAIEIFNGGAIKGW